MDFGASMFMTDYCIPAAELGRALEERGFESLWNPEHSHIPLSRKTPFPGGGDVPKMYYDAMDPFITLTAAATEGGIAVTVEDDGIGVPQEDLARILEPFEHGGGRSEGSEHAKGAGLGLTLVKAFAELHGGWLELDSKLGEGFKATVILPAAVPATAS